MKKFAFIFVTMFSLLSCTSNVGAAPLVDLTEAAEKSVEAVVYIKVTVQGKTQRYSVQDPFEDFFGGFFGGRSGQQREYREPDKHGAGSGVIISSDGYIVTNNHVVDGATDITVKLNDNREFQGKVVGTDATTDLALVKVDAKDLPTLPIGDSDQLKVGQWVLAVGNPFNLTSTVTAGIVSAKARSLGANGIESFIQTDAAINQGNSGGALVNEKGELVGINAMLYSQTGSYAGYGFAIPTSIMNHVVEDLKAYGSVQRAILGIRGGDVLTYLENEKARGRDTDLGTRTGVWIERVVEGSAAYEAGLQRGDVITKVDERDIQTMSQLQESIARHRPGDKIIVSYMREGKLYTTRITLDSDQQNSRRA